MQTVLFELGLVLFLLGLLWPHVELPHALGVTAVGLIVYSGYANWVVALLATAWAHRVQACLLAFLASPRG